MTWEPADMSYQHALVLYQTITPLHVGCGQDVGVVDLPVIRERTTGYPFIPGSGIRGSLRERYATREREEKRQKGRPEAEWSEDTDLLFGPAAGGEDEEESRHAGCVAVHDAKLLLFPVRSDQKVFLWITCPAVLGRFERDLGVFLPGCGWPEPPAAEVGEEEVLAPSRFDTPLYLEEFSYDVRGAAPAGDQGPGAFHRWLDKTGSALGWSGLADRAVLVSDRTFHHYVSHATSVLQHNRLNAAKTVEGGALFAVEAVPPESVFYGILGGTTSRRPTGEKEAPLTPRQVLEKLHVLWGDGLAPAATHLHLGGDEGTGLGVTQLDWALTEEAPGVAAAVPPAEGGR